MLGEILYGRLERRIVDPPPPDVEEIPTLVAGQDPGRANRPVIVRAPFAGDVPTLHRHEPLGGRREFVAVAPDPMALNHRPTRRDRRLLILGGKGVAADLKLQGFQNMERLAFGRESLANLPTMLVSISKRDGLLEFRDRWKA